MASCIFSEELETPLKVLSGLVGGDGEKWARMDFPIANDLPRCQLSQL